MTDQKLADYVNSAIKKGKAPEEIRASLLEMGWDENEVSKALSSALALSKAGGNKKEASGMKNGGKSHKTIYIAGLLIVIAIVAITSIYVFFILPATPVPGEEKCGNSFCGLGETHETCPSDCTEPEPPGPPAGPVSLSVSPATKTINNGETFVLDFKIAGASDVFGFQFDVEYNPSVLQFQKSDQGTFLNKNGQDNTFCVDYKNSSGAVRNIACTRLGKGSAEGEGILDKITFKAIGSGTSDVKITNVKIANSNAEKIEAGVVNGEVTVV